MRYFPLIALFSEFSTAPRHSDLFPHLYTLNQEFDSVDTALKVFLYEV